MIILFIIIQCVILSPLIYRNIRSDGYDHYVKDSLLLDSLRKVLFHVDKMVAEKSNTPSYLASEPFSFDPNTIGFQDMIRLGFDTLIANRILRYRKNGGIFYIREDLKKIYDLPENLYRKLESLIDLPVTKETASDADLPDPPAFYPAEKDERRDRQLEFYFNLNEADTLLLKQLPGIGSVLSARIIKYRELLGGYVSLDQLKEVYGLQSPVVEELKSSLFIDSTFTPMQIRINFSEWRDLVRHPYITPDLAEQMIRLRSLKGPYKQADDFKELKDMNDSLFYKLQPYLQF